MFKKGDIVQHINNSDIKAVVLTDEVLIEFENGGKESVISIRYLDTNIFTENIIISSYFEIDKDYDRKRKFQKLFKNKHF